MKNLKTIFFLAIVVLFGFIFIHSGLWMWPVAGVFGSICVIRPETSGCDNNPPWGPFLDNPSAKFSIGKLGDNYILTYNYLKKDGYFMIENSSIDLNPYIGKKIRIPGHFHTVHEETIDQQCIQGICHQTVYNGDVIKSKYTVNIDQVVLEK